jgi:hypothetical protein
VSGGLHKDGVTVTEIRQGTKFLPSQESVHVTGIAKGHHAQYRLSVHCLPYAASEDQQHRPTSLPNVFLPEKKNKIMQILINNF